MSLKYKDYYQILDISRDAEASEIRKKYRDLAKIYHPDATSGDKVKEEKFKEISEAYEVLGDAEKRQKYDSLGANWQAGGEFSPPPGWENIVFNFSGGQPGQGGGGFSDFFDVLFGGIGQQHGGGGMGGLGDLLNGARRRSPGVRQSFARRGEDITADMTITVQEAFAGGKRSISLKRQTICGHCSGHGGDGSIECPTCSGHGNEMKTQAFDITIPMGVKDGTTIRLSGQGGAGSGGGPVGDLYIKLNFAPDKVFMIDGYDITVEVKIAPWEAALGAEVEVRTLEGTVTLKIPKGVQSGLKMRLRGQGLKKTKGKRGDQYAMLKIVMPKKLTKVEKKLFEELKAKSKFKPRG